MAIDEAARGQRSTVEKEFPYTLHCATAAHAKGAKPARANERDQSRAGYHCEQVQPAP
jgi:hypothetical protein